MSRMKLLMEVKEDVENLLGSVSSLLDALESDNVEEPKELSIEDVRKILADKSRAGHTAKVRELLQKYGVKKLSEIEPGKYQDLVADAEKLQ